MRLGRVGRVCVRKIKEWAGKTVTYLVPIIDMVGRRKGAKKGFSRRLLRLQQTSLNGG